MAQIGQSEARPHADPHPIVVAKQFAKLNHDFDIGPSVQVKQMGHWSLNWIECCPPRLPVSTFSRFAGGARVELLRRKKRMRD